MGDGLYEPEISALFVALPGVLPRSSRVRVSVSRMNGDDQQQSRLFYELCSLVFSFVRSPHLFLPMSAPSPRLGGEAPVCRTPRRGQVSLGEIASLLLGASLTLLLCGLVTFMLGCILMPWVVGFVMLFYFMGIVSSLSGIGKAILSPSVPATSRSSPKEASGIL